MTSESNSKGKKIKEDIERILKDIKELSKDVDETGEEIEETGEDVDKIKENVDDIKKEVGETGEDVEEIKEDIEEIKEDIGTLTKTMSRGKKIFSKVATSVLPNKFAFKDIAQQIVGATILSAPFAVTEEVWNLARNLDQLHIIALISITVLFDVLLFYYTKYQGTESKKTLIFPLRIISLITVTYVTSAVVLSIFGVIGGQIQDPFWAMKLIVMVGLFANIGAGTADLIK
ncbi:MAG: DUF2391 family protein [Candidatus Woesearchaeota archaeon]|jgi:uncharacterized membrane protein|nr:DUF2391 family protein [Candidatus Woesearchaeota archaeon]MDP7622813.1 DUF2391 family protein [Candidatus Woesearchaeota archaeon]HJN56928.1 DUF2391 family protein [Candidatus Woesearchaeota archaeon]|tara:strand:+ start:68760 stop:69452 length:693 start_codon:yes stop_codon:yes gene_type:complete